MKNPDSEAKPAPRPDLGSVPEFRGRRRTLFVPAAPGEWQIFTWNGSEATLPEEDLEDFITHCLRHQKPEPETSS